MCAALSPCKTTTNYQNVFELYPTNKCSNNALHETAHSISQQLQDKFGLFGIFDLIHRMWILHDELLCTQLERLAWQRLHHGRWDRVDIVWRWLYTLTAMMRVNILVTQFEICKKHQTLRYRLHHIDQLEVEHHNKQEKLQSVNVLNAVPSSSSSSSPLRCVNIHSCQQLLKRILRTIDMALLMGAEFGRSRFNRCASSLSLVLNDLYDEVIPTSSDCITNASDMSIDDAPAWTFHALHSHKFNVSRVAHLDIVPFTSIYYTQHIPVISSGLIDDWPAMTTRAWSNISYIKKICCGRTVPIEIGSHYNTQQWEQKLMTVDEFIDKYVTVRAECRDNIGYLAQHDLFQQIPQLADDVTPPDLVCAGNDENSIRSNVWFGPAGTESPLHTDPDHNLLCQVVGRKYVRLYASSETMKLYPRYHNGVCSNTSEVDCLTPDLQKHPEFAHAIFHDCILQPGDVLFIPARMWHFVQSLSISFSVNFWFN